MLRLSSQTQQSRVRAQLELLLRNAEPGERLPRLQSVSMSAEPRSGKS